MRHALGTAAAPSVLCAEPGAAQPFEGTAFMSPNVITAADPGGLRSISYAGRAERPIFDRRTGEWATVEVYLFDVRLRSRDVEFRVNPEFADVASARAEVDAFAPSLGRLPAALLSGLNYVVVNAGDELFAAVIGGSWPGGIIIHTEYGHGLGGFLEETLFHESAHAALDIDHAASPAWRAAQQADGGFISDGIVNLLRAARSCPVKSTLPIVFSGRTSPHPIQRTRGCGAGGGEPTAGGVD